MMRHTTLTFTSSSEQQTASLAATIAGQCAAGDCIALKGDLGTGKTVFARGFIRALGDAREDIVSPTFTLAQTYPTRAGWPVWHFDLYRLKHARELTDIGLQEALESGVSLIEWPELAQEMLPPQALTVEMAYDKTGSGRQVTLSGDAAVWQQKLQSLTGGDNARL